MSYKRVSFTGTRIGANELQISSMFRWLLANCEGLQMASHGCCVGADLQFHSLIRKTCGSDVKILVFPSTADTAAPIPDDADFVAERRPPLERNKTLIDKCPDVLLATPKEMREILRSGTWSAIRYARDVKKIPHTIFYPDGTTKRS